MYITLTELHPFRLWLIEQHPFRLWLNGCEIAADKEAEDCYQLVGKPWPIYQLKVTTLNHGVYVIINVKDGLTSKWTEVAFGETHPMPMDLVPKLRDLLEEKYLQSLPSVY